jgi:hypothetical protein
MNGKRRRTVTGPCSDIKGGIQAEGVREQTAEEDIAAKREEVTGD